MQPITPRQGARGPKETGPTTFRASRRGGSVDAAVSQDDQDSAGAALWDEAQVLAQPRRENHLVEGAMPYPAQFRCIM